MPYRSVTATTTSQQIVQFNPKRTALGVRNNGTNPVFISEDPTGVSSSGWFLNQNDAILLEGNPEYPNLTGVDDCARALWIQTTGGNSDIRIYEGYRT